MQTLAVQQYMPKVGDWTPWGVADRVELVGDSGIVFVSTPSHGGYWVPPSLDVEIDPLYRAWGQRWAAEGWYEEDCCAAAVAVCLSRFFSPEQVERASTMLRGMRASGSGPWRRALP